MSANEQKVVGASNKHSIASLSMDAMHFDGFVVLPGERRLIVNGESAKIGSRAFDLLLTLIASRDRVVSKEELLERVWTGLVVEENNLSVHVSQIRKYCGPRALSTIPGRGYQFTASSVESGARRSSVSKDNDRDDAVESPRLHSASCGNLPSLLAPLIGRDQELNDVEEMLLIYRWVTITGAGGMGKTRLAEAVGQRLSKVLQAWIVELASVSDPKFVANTVAQVLGVTIVDNDRPLESIVQSLQGQNVLLILDNCEHLIPTVGPLCVNLLRELPLLRILVTSQELLRGEDERIYKLGPLALPDP